MRHVHIQRDFDSWRTTSRTLLDHNIAPEEVIWSDSDQQALLPAFEQVDPDARASNSARVPATFIDACRRVACHRNPQRWSLMYRVLHRLTHGEPNLLDVSVDEDVHQFLMMEKAVSRDRHKMTPPS